MQKTVKVLNSYELVNLYQGYWELNIDCVYLRYVLPLNLAKNEEIWKKATWIYAFVFKNLIKSVLQNIHQVKNKLI